MDDGVAESKVGKDSLPQATPLHKTPYLVAARPHPSAFSLPPLPSPDPVAAYLSRLAPTSRLTMGKLLNRIAHLLAPTLSAANLFWPQLRYADTLRLRDQLSTRYAPATANLALAGLRGVLREAWRLGQISHDDFQRTVDLAPLRGSRRRVPFPIGTGDIERLMRICSEDRSPRGCRDLAILSVLYGGGLRRSELTALDLSDFQRNTLRVCGKGQQYRLAYLPEVTAQRIEDWLATRGSETGPLFVAIYRSGRIARRKLSSETIARIVRDRAVNAGLGRLTPHDLRRAMATQLLSAGVDVFTVQKILRHASVSTTAIYDRRNEVAQQAAAGLLFT